MGKSVIAAFGIAIRGVGNLNIADQPMANSVGYYIDDFNVGATANGTINPELQDMERIEIQRGPQGTYFGRNAIGGAINTTTKKPDATPYGEISASDGRFNTWDVRAVSNIPLSDTFFVRGVVAHSESDGFIKNVNPGGAPNSGYEDTNIRLAARWLAAPKLTVDLSATYTDESGGMDNTVPSGVIDQDTLQTLGLTKLAAFSQGLGFYPQNQSLVNHNAPEYNKNTFAIVNARVTYAADGFDVKSITGYIHSTNGRMFDEDNMSADIFNRLNRWHTDSYSEELRFQSISTSRLQWTAGGIAAEDKIFQFNDVYAGTADSYTDPSTGMTFQFLPPLPNGFPLNENNETLDTKSLGLFAEGTYSLTDDWLLTLGGRYTRDDVTTAAYGVLAFGSPVPNASGSKTFNDFSPRAVIKYLVNSHITTYASASSDYKAGGVDINGGVTTSFNPEKVRDYEAGIKTTLADDRLRVNFAGFYLDWTDMQVVTDYLANSNISSSVQKTLNASGATSKGAEFELQALPLKGLQLGFAAGYLDARFRSFPNAVVHGGEVVDLTGQTIPKAAKWTLSGNTQYSAPIAPNVDGFVRVEEVYRSSIAGNLDAVRVDGTGGRAHYTVRALIIVVFFMLWGTLLSGLAAAQSNGSSLTQRDRLHEFLAGATVHPVTQCSALRAQSDYEVTVVSADLEPSLDGKTALCRVHGVVMPEVQFLLELPDSWNGRLYALGNGGYAGESVIGDYGSIERKRAHDQGFVTVFSNLGHDRTLQPGAAWAHNNLSKRIDFGLRALHVTTETAKRLAALYYGERPQRSYFDGCSTGGGQALKEAQRFPNDYDGIVAGAPVFDFVRLQLYGWNNQMAIGTTPLTPEKVALLGRIILDKYDALDGVRDRVIGDPLAIDFVPERDLPRASAGKPGFNDAEIATLTRLYAGPRLDGRQLAPGLPVGAEAAGQTYVDANLNPGPPESGWAGRLIPDAHGDMQQRGNVETWLKYLAFEMDDPDMTIERLDPRRDIPRMQEMSRITDATDPDLAAFKAHGGKLIVYHGWADTGVNPLMTVQYYERVREIMGQSVDGFFRLFMVPGMFHCRGGLNVDRFDAVTAVIGWVERGEAPDMIEAARVVSGGVVRTRPLCPHPQVAQYKGAGNTDSAASFVCSAPKHH